MQLKILKTSLIFLGLYVTGILSEEVLKNQIDAKQQGTNSNAQSTKKLNSSTTKTLTMAELFPNFFLEPERKLRNDAHNEIPNTLHSLYSEERDLCIGYDSIRGNRVKRHKCPENCPCKKFRSINADEETNKRFKRHNSFTESTLQTDKEVDFVEIAESQTEPTSEPTSLQPNVEADTKDLIVEEESCRRKDHVQKEHPKVKNSNSEDLDHLETINRPQFQIDPAFNFRKHKCLENCINLNNVEFDGDNHLILKSEDLEQAKKDEARRKREEECKFCIIKGLIELGEKLNQNKKSSKKSKCCKKKASRNKYARRQSKFESILRKFEPKISRRSKKRPVNLS